MQSKETRKPATVTSTPVRLPATTAPTADDVCQWLAAGQSLDDVARKSCHLRLVHEELGKVIALLRQHVLTAMGERTIDLDPRPRHVSDEVPF